ncbi:MAG: hypothetical protein LBR42_02320 [Candidatus Methanoplasma sp.]|jgi:hypothetical protein|nr:hypothetical protein [Candidatus Methanoplasma sp.]
MHEDDHHDDHHDHHDDDHHENEHERLHLEMHRAVDELGKYAIDINIDSPEGVKKEVILKFIDDLMTSVTESSMAHGADLVGHVKSFLSNDDGNIMSSIVDHREPARIKDSLESDTVYKARFMLHIIVHGIWDDHVRESVLDVLDDTFRKWGIPYVVEADHYDTEKSIAHHTR